MGHLPGYLVFIDLGEEAVGGSSVWGLGDVGLAIVVGLGVVLAEVIELGSDGVRGVVGRRWRVVEELSGAAEDAREVVEVRFVERLVGVGEGDDVGVVGSGGLDDVGRGGLGSLREKKPIASRLGRGQGLRRSVDLGGV
jgi:hypothetical protein